MIWVTTPGTRGRGEVLSCEMEEEIIHVFTVKIRVAAREARE